MNYFPNANFWEWLWTGMNFVGVIASVINAWIIYTRGNRTVEKYKAFIITRALGLLFIQRVLRSNILGIIVTLFTILGVLVIVASNDPLGGLYTLVGPVFGFSFFVAGFLITLYQLIEIMMRPQIDEALDEALIKGYDPLQIGE